MDLSRQERQQAILKLLSEQRIERQAEIVAALCAQSIPATQSCVSRDLRQLGIVKDNAGYQLPEDPGQAKSEQAPSADALDRFVRDVRTAGDHLTVIRTGTGAAQRLAVLLDRSGWPEITGTVSGDDTIFVATASGTEQRKLLSRLRPVTAP